MFFLLIFSFILYPIKIQSDGFYPCACCKPETSICVHNGSNTQSSSIDNEMISTYTLDTSTYCCIPLPIVRISAKNDNVSLFNKHCQIQKDGGKHIVLFTTILSSYEYLSKQCHEKKNGVLSKRNPTLINSDFMDRYRENYARLSKNSRSQFQDDDNQDARASLAINDDDGTNDESEIKMKELEKIVRKYQLTNSNRSDRVRLSMLLPGRVNKEIINRNNAIMQTIESKDVKKNPRVTNAKIDFNPNEQILNGTKIKFQSIWSFLFLFIINIIIIGIH